MPAGASVTHRSPAFRLRPDALRLPGAASCPAPPASPGGPTPRLLELPLNFRTAKYRAAAQPCATAAIQFAQRNFCSLRNRSRSTGIIGHDRRNTHRLSEYCSGYQHGCRHAQLSHIVCNDGRRPVGLRRQSCSVCAGVAWLGDGPNRGLLLNGPLHWGGSCLVSILGNYSAGLLDRCGANGLGRMASPD